MRAVAVIIAFALATSGMRARPLLPGPWPALPVPAVLLVLACEAAAVLLALILRVTIPDGFGGVPASYWSVTP